jgi:hypothetical protein
MRDFAAERRSILNEKDLVTSPGWRRRVFWQGYKHWRSRSVRRLGDAMSQLSSESTLQSLGVLGELAQAWQSVIPPNCRDCSTVTAFIRGKGRLVVSVDDAATKYALSRQAQSAVIRRLNGTLGEDMVKSINYRIDRRHAAMGAKHRAERTDG